MDRILLRFSEENVEKPLTAQVILELGIPMRIVAATVDAHGGDILLEVPRVHVEKIVKAFKDKGVDVTFPKLIEVDCDKCIDCGGCISLCPTEALHFNSEYRLEFEEDKCISCFLCLDSCCRGALFQQ